MDLAAPPAIGIEHEGRTPPQPPRLTAKWAVKRQSRDIPQPIRARLAGAKSPALKARSRARGHPLPQAGKLPTDISLADSLTAHLSMHLGNCSRGAGADVRSPASAVSEQRGAPGTILLATGRSRQHSRDCRLTIRYRFVPNATAAKAAAI
jgi:hypothetical protein